MKHLLFLVTICLSLVGFSQKTNFFQQAKVYFPNKYGCAGIEQMGNKIHSLYLGDKHSGNAMKWVEYDLSGNYLGEKSINCPYSDYGVTNFKIFSDGGLLFNGWGDHSNGNGSFTYKLDSNGVVAWSLRDTIGIYRDLEMLDDSTILCLVESDKKYKHLLPGTYLAKLNSNSGIIEVIKEFGSIKRNLPHTGYAITSQLKLINDHILISFKVNSLDTSCILKLNMNGELLATSEPILGNLNSVESFQDKYILVRSKRFGDAMRSKTFTLDLTLKNENVLFSNDTGTFHTAVGYIRSNSNLVLFPMQESDSLRTYQRDYIKWYDPEKGLVRECKYFDKDEKIGITVFQAFPNYGYLAIARYMDENSNYFSYMLKTDSLGLVYNTDIICDCKDYNTGIESKEKSELHIAVFPNPASQRVVVQLPHDQKAEITLRNTNGKVIEQQLTKVQRNELDVSALPRGIYLLEVKTEDLVGMRKIVVE
ncbi:MAG: T9SS type A sorting domain-containing protein [Flavobacteriales bacterium]|nr:T9SS type A sorting domain-containing protein [Flavobacteriales bacterium]